MKSKQLAKHTVLIAAFILFTACSRVQVPVENASNQETYESEYQETSIEPSTEYEANEPEDESGTPDSDSEQQAADQSPPTEATSEPEITQVTPIPPTA